MTVEQNRATKLILPIALCLGLTSLLLSSDFGDSTKSPSHYSYDLERRAKNIPDTVSTYLRCESDARRGAALAVSIITAEALTRGDIEVLLESVVIRFGGFVGMRPPPLSLGPAQIGYHHFADSGGTAGQYWDVVRDPCATMEYVMDWLDANGMNGRDRSARRAAFARWSGHAAEGNEALRYENLAYFGFTEVVFARVTALMTEF